MKIVWSENSWNDYFFWQLDDKKMLRKINSLIKDIFRDAFDGLGKPEPLKHELTGYWLRRINEEHRLVYGITDDMLYMVACSSYLPLFANTSQVSVNYL